MVQGKAGADWLPDKARCMDGTAAGPSPVLTAIEGKKTAQQLLSIDQAMGGTHSDQPMQEHPSEPAAAATA